MVIDALLSKTQLNLADGLKYTQNTRRISVWHEADNDCIRFVIICNHLQQRYICHITQISNPTTCNGCSTEDGVDCILFFSLGIPCFVAVVVLNVL